MKDINGTKYYTKKEMAQMIGCSLGTINARIIATKIDGYYLGHAKHYTTEQVRRIAEYRKTPTTPNND